MTLTEEERAAYDAIVAGILAGHPDDGNDDGAAERASARAIAAIKIRRVRIQDE